MWGSFGVILGHLRSFCLKKKQNFENSESPRIISKYLKNKNLLLLRAKKRKNPPRLAKSTISWLFSLADCGFYLFSIVLLLDFAPNCREAYVFRSFSTLFMYLRVCITLTSLPKSSLFQQIFWFSGASTQKKPSEISLDTEKTLRN